VTVPATPEEIAQQATDLSAAGDHATGGGENVLRADDGENVGDEDAVQAAPAPVKAKRLWSLSDDHTERNRGGFDSLKPDASEVY
jgi:hypothetical protein